ncbi:MAG: hypothetical protein Q9213_007100 [Squamulea squamosa]
MAQKLALFLMTVALPYLTHASPNPNHLATRAAQTAEVVVFTSPGCVASELGGVQMYTLTANQCYELKAIPNIPETPFSSYRVTPSTNSNLANCEFQVFALSACGGSHQSAAITQEGLCKNG